ncbi:ribose-5-phosphate isomerase A [Listeria fleischmannii 1991]|uniref:Ribose-5-phosphate isomerase A n=2 Tax=Listeria fleischmannii TaxID=1069827 RepID=A0A2X3H8X5_9LIST|nr:ribose-5-phosphate isomerase RpiA [Listeria fleischmannii]EMG29252.1 ribose-5-phosphate isomerase A [Listeria fleischmannii subsp. fleischmannii LU2006-1]KMT58711.1 ribose-5-phosphate isomerase A [Listeria fleischmannii 1991]SQC70996.1 Ribose-5-phosphate isomerase A [Listeria fleischmannii subsp. fleischmannii]
MESKRIAGEKACEAIKDGMTVGLGTGSTVFYTIERLGMLVKNGLEIKGVATSIETEELAKKWHIPLLSFNEVTEIDVTIDGADEVNHAFEGIKGGGGALLREKLVALSSKQNIWVVDESKVVDVLGKFHLPVEVLPFSYKYVERELLERGIKAHIRYQADGEIFITNNENMILDLEVYPLVDAKKLSNELDSLSGIVEHGLFLNIANQVIVGKKDGTIEILH